MTNIQFSETGANFKLNMNENDGDISVSVDGGSESMEMEVGETSESFDTEFGEESSETEMGFGEGSSAIVDHRFLSGRDSEEQHPISAISGLEEELKEVVGIPFSNLELEALLK